VTDDLAGVVAAASRATGLALDPARVRPVGGGCINAAWRLETGDGPVFLKTNAARRQDMFEAEADGLAALGRADGVRVPRVLGTGVAGADAWLMLEWIEPGRATAATEEALGRGLANQHRAEGQAFGWHRDNWIGATPQENSLTGNWADFFAQHRLVPQLDLIETGGLAGGLIAQGRRLVEGVPALLSGHAPAASLLHGDLWGGNWTTDDAGVPWLFDPAVYHGDREADLAMTRLFGGFGRAFYAAYEDAWPLPPGAGLRADLYNLYHVLNHVNLFGSGYLSQARSLIERLLSELRA
jgi:protein-ribulosamine 3-kinase